MTPFVYNIYNFCSFDISGSSLKIFNPFEFSHYLCSRF